MKEIPKRVRVLGQWADVVVTSDPIVLQDCLSLVDTEAMIIYLNAGVARGRQWESLISMMGRIVCTLMDIRTPVRAESDDPEDGEDGTPAYDAWMSGFYATLTDNNLLVPIHDPFLVTGASCGASAS